MTNGKSKSKKNQNYLRDCPRRLCVYFCVLLKNTEKLRYSLIKEAKLRCQ